ncbi:MAG: YceI family protein [Desulfobacterales bacterium]|jgi:polyisoprenoid-binding protein YceI
MRKTTKITATVMFLMAIILQAQAAGSDWKLDPAHAGIYFEIDHIYAVTRGYFEEFDGKVIFDPDNLGGSIFDFKVEVDSINTGNSKRDGHLEGNEFFGARKFPVMTFKSTNVKKVEGDQYVVEGTLTVKDVSKTVSVPFTFFGIKQSPFDKDSEVAGFEARLAIDRLEYNVGNGKYYEMGVIGKDVDVLISFEATRKK